MTRIVTIKKRADFLAVRGGAKVSTPAFLIEAKRRQKIGSTSGIELARFGLTVTKKLGNAVKRNRIRRRLRAAIAGSMASQKLPGVDYVIVARAAAFDRPFTVLVADLINALNRLSTSSGAGRELAGKKGKT